MVHKPGSLILYDKEDKSFVYEISDTNIVEQTFAEDMLDFFADEKILLLIKYYTLFFPELLNLVTSFTQDEISFCFLDKPRSRKKDIEEQV